MKKLLLFCAGYYLLLSCNNQPAASAPAATKDSMTVNKPASTPPSEFADGRYVDMGKKQLAALSSGDMNAWLAPFADSAVFHWSGGDSLAGKEAITKYWTERRGKVIDSISFSLDIWLPLKVNKPQQGPDMPGVWLLSWYKVNVKYKNGKKLTFWVHTDQHYNNNDKIDVLVQYIDKAPINKALGK